MTLCCVGLRNLNSKSKIEIRNHFFSQRKFPTTTNRVVHGRFGNNRSRLRSFPYILSCNQRWRPSCTDIMTRGVIIPEKGAEHVPIKTEKEELDRKGHSLGLISTDNGVTHSCMMTLNPCIHCQLTLSTLSLLQLLVGH